MTRRLVLAVLGLLAWLAPATPAPAHTSGSTGYAEFTVDASTVRLRLNLPLEVPPAGGVDPGGLPPAIAAKVTVTADGRACAAVPAAAVPPAPDRATVQVVVTYACGGPIGELAIRDATSELFGAGHHTIATVEWAGGREQRVFEDDRRDATVRIGPTPEQSPAAAEAEGGFVAYLAVGVEHILLGFDHVLFVVALILQGGCLLSMLAIVTAFTLAHSITLALSVLDIVSIPGRIVEPVIALSIAYVAAENIFLRDRAASRRWAVGFVFGLVHGFGFAGALREIGLPADGLFGVLLGFNLGVEAGQALIVAALLPVLAWFRRFPWEGRLVRASSAAILAAGLLLLVERALLGGT